MGILEVERNVSVEKLLEIVLAGELDFVHTGIGTVYFSYNICSVTPSFADLLYFEPASDCCNQLPRL